MTFCIEVPYSSQMQKLNIKRIRGELSQSEFAELLGVPVRTLQDWEQGRREPSGAAKTLIKVAELHPEILQELAV